MSKLISFALIFALVVLGLWFFGRPIARKSLESLEQLRGIQEELDSLRARIERLQEAKRQAGKVSQLKLAALTFVPKESGVNQLVVELEAISLASGVAIVDLQALATTSQTEQKQQEEEAQPKKEKPPTTPAPISSGANQAALQETKFKASLEGTLATIKDLLTRLEQDRIAIVIRNLNLSTDPTKTRASFEGSIFHKSRADMERTANNLEIPSEAQNLTERPFLSQ